MKNRSRLFGVALCFALSTQLTELKQAEAANCTKDALCRVGIAPAGALSIAASKNTLWAVGKKGRIWKLGDPIAPELASAASVKSTNKRDLYAAHGFAEGIYAVGVKGTTLRILEGGEVVQEKTPANKHLYGVWAENGDSVWAVGAGGTIVHKSGGKWTVEPSGVKSTLRAVWGTSAENILAVGDSGVILRRTESGWTRIHTSDNDWIAVGGRAANDALIAGAEGAALHWDGSALHAIETGTVANLTVAAIIGPTDRLLLGRGGEGSRFVWGEFREVQAGEGNFQALATASGIGWFLSDDETIWRYAGGWKLDEKSANTGGINATARATLTAPTQFGGKTIAAGEITIVGGDEGRIAILDASGKWIALPAQSREKFSTVMGLGFDRNTIFAIDHIGRLMSIGAKGATFAQLPNPNGTNFSALWMGDGVGAAAGGNGTLLWFDGKKWSQAKTDTEEDLRGVAGVARDAVWAVGSDGIVIHWDGAKWEKQPSGTDLTFDALAVASKELAVAAGSGGAVALWNGKQWTFTPAPLRTYLRGACLSNSRNMVVTSNTGEIMSYDGAQWTVEASPTGQALRSCVVTSSGEIFVGGQGGAVVSRKARGAAN